MKKLLAIISLLVLVISCKDKEIYYRFTDDERKLFPSFKVGDTLIFRRIGDVKFEKYVVQQIDNGYSIEKSPGTWTKFYYELFRTTIVFVSGSENQKFENMYKIEISKIENSVTFYAYWNVEVNTNNIALKDTIEAYTDNSDMCDSNTIKPSNGTFKKLYYLKQKGIISFEDCEGKTWNLKQ